MKIMQSTGVFGAAFVGLLAFAGAVRASDDLVPSSRYDDARASGMGNAYLGLASDGASSLFYNPAGIGKIRGFSAEALNLNLQMTPGLVGMTNLELYQFPNLDSWKDKLSGDEGVVTGGGYQLAPTVSFRGFSFGILYKEMYSATLESDGSTLDYSGHAELVPAIGTSVRLASGIVRLGYVAQYVQKAEGTGRVPLSTSGLSYKDGIPEGAGLSHNFGASISLPLSFLPTFSAVGRNLFGLQFGSPFLALSDGTGGTPEDEPMTWDFGITSEFKMGAGSTMFASLEYRDAFDASGATLLSRINMGVEAMMFQFLSLRAGLGSGYPSLGVGLRLRRATMSFAWYSVERGDGFWTDRDDRYAFQIQVKSF